MTAREEARGDCFVVAYQLATESTDREYRLIHATVLRQEDGLRHPHAWVEFTEVYEVPLPDGEGTAPVSLDSAVDRANGNDLLLPAQVYRKFGRVKDAVEYTADEAMRLALRHGHYGPWA